MKLIKLNKNKAVYNGIELLTALLLILVIFIVYQHNRSAIKIIIGGQFYKQLSESEGKDIDKYFRP